MPRKSIFFSKRTSPVDFTRIAEKLIGYFLFLKESTGYDFDQIEFSLNKSTLKFVNIDQLNDPGFKTILANELLKYKLPDIKRYHPGATPTVAFKEDIGMDLIIASYRQKLSLLTFSFYVGGEKETLLIDGFKKINFKAQDFYSFFKLHCEYMKPDYGYLTSSTIQKQQKPPEYFFGWMNYFSNSLPLPALPPWCEIEDIDGIGKLLITTRDEFDAVTNPAHFEKAMQLVDLFRQHGVVRPK